ELNDFVGVASTRSFVVVSNNSVCGTLMAARGVYPICTGQRSVFAPDTGDALDSEAAVAESLYRLAELFSERQSTEAASSTVVNIFTISLHLPGASMFPPPSFVKLYGA